MAFLLSRQNVFDYLIEQGLCNQEEHAQSEIELKAAKHFNVLMTLPEGRKLFVKQERSYQHGETAANFSQEWRIQEFVKRFPQLSQMRSWISEAIHYDVEHSIIVFNYLNDSCNLMDFYTKEAIFPTALVQRDAIASIASTIGIALATIHRLTLDCREYREFLLETRQDVLIHPTLHLVRQLRRISPEIFSLVPADALRFFALYQRYDSLGQAIAELTTAFEPCCLTHNDLKLNNILLSSDWQLASSAQVSDRRIVQFIDWECSSWGDPAFDLGTLIASYLQIWLSSLITSKAITIDESLRMATIPLEHLQPSLAVVAIAYVTHFPEVLERRPNFLRRVVQFAGLALILQILSMIQYRKTFGNRGICMLQVAKTLLGRPEQSIATVFGLEASELIAPVLPLKSF